MTSERYVVVTQGDSNMKNATMIILAVFAVTAWSGSILASFDRVPTIEEFNIDGSVKK
jgi:hypothetical protein